MALRKGENPSLQEIIDSYNRELLNYRTRASASSPQENEALAASASSAPQPPAPTRPEPNQPVQNQPQPSQPAPQSPTPAPPAPTPPDKYKPQEGREPFPGQLPLRELSDELLEQLRRMPRPLPAEYLEPENAAPASAAALDEEAAGAAEYRQGMRELEQGLIDLAQGEKELREGIEAYEQGIRERDAGLALAAQASTQPLDSGSADREYLSDPRRVAAQDAGRDGSQALGFGRLRISASAARQAIPIASAYVQVIKRTLQGDTLIGATLTNELGLTQFFELPVDASNDGGMTAPFEEYIVNVSAAGYQPIVGLVAQVFAGISGTLPVFLVPLSEEERL